MNFALFTFSGSRRSGQSPVQIHWRRIQTPSDDERPYLKHGAAGIPFSKDADLPILIQRQPADQMIMTTNAIMLGTAPVPSRGLRLTQVSSVAPSIALRLERAASSVGVSTPTFKKWVQDGLMPRPVVVGNIRLWLLDELAAALLELPRENDHTSGEDVVLRAIAQINRK